jgi:hypothetical protein
MLENRHSLLLLNADGSVTRIFEHEGDALWEHSVGEHLALDSKGRRIALVARSEGVQARSPDAHLMEGELEIWDVEKHERLAPSVRAVDDALAWLPDGKRVVYTALIARDEAVKCLRRHVKDSEPFGRGTLAWQRIAVVHVLDVETGETRALHAGERPVLSPDGKRLLVRDFELHWRLLDMESNVSKAVTAPGAIYPGAIAFVDPSTVLYWAWPTEGIEPEYTENNSPLVGKKQMRTLKLVDLRDGRFQTVLPSIDPRRSVSFGRR